MPIRTSRRPRISPSPRARAALRTRSCSSDSWISDSNIGHSGGHRMVERIFGRLAAVSLLVCAVAVGGCAAEQLQHKREGELAELLSWLPGRYDNVAQAERDAKSGVHPAHQKIAIVIIPVQTPRLGHHVFYAQEMSVDSPQLVVSERMLSFDIDAKRGIVGLIYNFIEPSRWRDGAQNP